MRRWRSWIDDRGSASLEFITVGLLLLLPLIYLVLVVAALQSAAYGAEAAARNAARLFVQQPDLTTATQVAEDSARFTLADYGVDPPSSSLSVACQPEQCLQTGALVTVTVRVSVALPVGPAVLPLDLPLAIPLEASAVQRVSTFGSG